MAGAAGAMTGFAYPEALVQIVGRFGPATSRARPSCSTAGAADALRVPGRHRHGDSQGSAPPPRPRRDPRRAPGAGWTKRRSRRSIACCAGRPPGRSVMDLGLAGKVAMVGGASRGLGFAVARLLLREGARVSMPRASDAIWPAARDRARDRRGAARRGARHGRGPASGDAIPPGTRPRSRASAASTCCSSTRAVRPPGGALASTMPAWQRAFELLLLSAVRLARLAVPVDGRARRRQHRRLDIVGGQGADRQPGAVERAARVGGALAKTLSNELAPQGIRVNHLLPGRIDTDRVRQLDEARSQQAGVTVEEQRAARRRRFRSAATAAGRVRGRRVPVVARVGVHDRRVAAGRRRHDSRRAVRRRAAIGL